MATTVGALIVELRANSAQFTAEMDNARKTLGKTGAGFHGTTQQMSRMAAIATQTLVPGLEGSRQALEGVFRSVIGLRETLGAVGPAAGVVAAALGSFWAGNFLANFRELQGLELSWTDRLKVAAGGIEALKEHLKKAADEQKAFGDAMSKSRDIATTLAKELATLRGDQDALLGLRAKDREDAIIKAFEAQGHGGNPKVKQLLEDARKNALEDTAKTLAEQRRLRDENDQKLLEQITKERDEQVKKWKEETEALRDELKNRLASRQQFEAALGMGGFGDTSLAADLAAVRSNIEKTQKEARDLAFGERDLGVSQSDSSQEREAIRGRALADAEAIRQKFGGIPAVMNALDNAIASVDFGNLGREMESARSEVDRLVPTLTSLQEGVGTYAAALIQTLPATDQAREATRALTQGYVDLSWAIYGAAQQMANFLGASVEASGQQPQAATQ